MAKGKSNPEEDREAEETAQQLQAMADEWRERLKNPDLQAQLKAGVVEISPMVKQLLDAFPPVQNPSTDE